MASGSACKSSRARAGTITRIRWFVWSDGKICEEHDENGDVIKRFFPQGEQMYGNNYYYTRDQLGSVREMLDATGTVRFRNDYDPYGVATRIEGDLRPDFEYAGMYYHGESGLNLTLYRAYNPTLGRWLSRDPSMERSGLNLYAYVLNDPLNLIDPYGLDWTDYIPDVLTSPGLVNFAAGIGDNLSFGLTAMARNAMGIGDVVDECSGAYTAGEWVGTGLSLATGIAGGIKAAGAKGAGKGSLIGSQTAWANQNQSGMGITSP